jgi:hypothetical protein
MSNFRLQFKTPGVIDILKEDYDEEQIEEIKQFLENYILYDEYITIEFDTIDRTAKVVNISKNGRVD